MGSTPDPRPPMAVAVEWVARITTVAFEFFMPALAGRWCDQRWGTSFLAPLGLALGVAMGLWHLLLMVRVDRPR